MLLLVRRGRGGGLGDLFRWLGTVLLPLLLVEFFDCLHLLLLLHPSVLEPDLDLAFRQTKQVT